MHFVIGLKHADLTEKIIGVFFDVYNELKPVSTFSNRFRLRFGFGAVA
jgi:hypothetical protein